MLFLKPPLRTKLDLLKPDYGVNTYSGEFSQKDYHDSHSKDRHFSIGQKIMARNFLQVTTWVPRVIKECCGPLTYLVEIESGVLWRRNADHIKGLQESEMFGEERAVEYQLISVDAATESTNGSHCMEHASDTEAASPIGADHPTTDRPEGNQSPQMTYSEMLPPPESQRLPAEVIATRIAWNIRVECTYKCGILLLP